MVKVSVLMTAYNRENYIAEAIESVLLSTFEDFELIIVDDCSTDKTLEIATKYKSSDSRVKVYVNEKKLGDYPNRNKAASYAVGKYIKYLDSDDTMSQYCLERMFYEMETNPSCAFGITSRTITHVKIYEPEFAYRIHFFERGILDLGPSFAIIRRDIFLQENGFLELRCVSDFEFWLRLSLKYPMLELEKGLIFWRQHDQQEFSLKSHILQNLNFAIPIYEEKLALSKLSNTEKKIILQKYRKATIRYLLKNIFKFKIGDLIRLIRINKICFLDVF
jgi:glycosyltransferase involved in cell wall biosynthesis